ncbi:hypothetical protein [Pseudarthrobacter sp. Y6]|uniref:TY-Chap2 family putative peptide chaperone n=1 Tax=Pseudarthrobacter sp. Y6 TaxID=3418422 RepID=UPI003CF92698
MDGSTGGKLMYAEHGTIRYRQINALAWRVASELSRRDQGLYIGLTGYDGSAAHADALMLTNASGPEYQARRRGLGFTAGSGGDFQISWDRALAMSSARAIAIAMEESQNIYRPEKSPATTPRVLNYRVMASMLELTLGGRLEWSTSELSGGPLDPESSISRDRLQPWEDTRWILQRDGQPVAQLDNFGWLEMGDRRIDLYSKYRQLNGRLYPLMFDLFGRLLP